MVTYEDLVATDEQTCSACPTQWEGTLKDGRSFYFRYRWGYASLSFGATVDDAVMSSTGAGAQLGDDLDGFLTTEQYRDTFVHLYMKQEENH